MCIQMRWVVLLAVSQMSTPERALPRAVRACSICSGGGMTVSRQMSRNCTRRAGAVLSTGTEAQAALSRMFLEAYALCSDLDMTGLAD